MRSNLETKKEEGIELVNTCNGGYILKIVFASISNDQSNCTDFQRS